MKQELDISKYYDQIREFCIRWQITEFGIFGSFAMKVEDSESDIDVLVSFAQDSEWSLLDLVNMRDELSTMFGRKVDLVERAALKNPFRKQSILQSLEVVYAA